VKLNVDLETLQLIEGAGFRTPVTSLRFKRGDAARLEVAFLLGGSTPIAIGNPESLEIRFGVKPRNRYDASYLVFSNDWTMPEPNASSPAYVCSPSFNTVELNSVLNVGSAAATELPEITLMGEISWREGTGEPTSTRTFLVVVENDVNRGDEPVPTPVNPGPGATGGTLIDPAITALTGANSLAAKATVSMPVNTVLGIITGGQLAFYQLRTGADATSLPGIVRPDDWSSSTNSKVWFQIL
jgi:hypothetical protein